MQDIKASHFARNLAASSSSSPPSSRSVSSNSTNSSVTDNVDLTPRPLSLGRTGSVTSSIDRKASTSSISTVRHTPIDAIVGKNLVPGRRSSARFSSHTMLTRRSSKPSLAKEASANDKGSLLRPALSRGSLSGNGDLQIRKNRAEARSALLENSANIIQKDKDAISEVKSPNSDQVNKASRQSLNLRASSLQPLASFDSSPTPENRSNRAVTTGAFLKTELTGSVDEADEVVAFPLTPFGPVGLHRAASTTNKITRNWTRSSGRTTSGESQTEQELRRPRSSRGPTVSGEDSAPSRGYVRWQPSNREPGRRSIVSRVFSNLDLRSKARLKRQSSEEVEETAAAPPDAKKIDQASKKVADAVTPSEIALGKTNIDLKDSSADQESLVSVRRSSLSKSSIVRPGYEESFRWQGQPSTRSVADTSSVYSSLEKIILQFPQPPMLDEADSRYPTHRLSNTIHHPSLPVLQAKAIITPDVQSIDTDGAQSIWAAVEVSAEMLLPSSALRSQLPELCFLDVVVLIDTSVYTSPDCFASAIQATAFIGSELHKSTDRLSVIFSASSVKMPNILFPLQALRNLDLSALLKAYHHPMNQASLSSSSSHLDQGLEAATSMLQTTNENYDSHTPFRRARHIFVLSPKIGSWTPPSSGHDDIVFHMINPAAFPWPGQEGEGNGWTMDSQILLRQDSIGPSHQSNGLTVSLKNAIQHARYGLDTGMLTKVKVEIEAGENCVIGDAIGPLRSAELRPGQAIVLFVNVTIGKFERRMVQHRKSNVSRSSEESDELMLGLHAMLGSAESEFLKVSVTHNHPLFPKSTSLTTKFTGTIKRHTPESEWKGTQDRPRINDSEDNTNQMQQRLAYHVAANCEPRYAISVLEEMFGSGHCLSVTPDYISMIVNELRFRAFACARYRLCWKPGEDAEMKSMSTSSLWFSPTPLGIRNLRYSSQQGDPALMLLAASPESYESADQARRIWKDRWRAATFKSRRTL